MQWSAIAVAACAGAVAGALAALAAARIPKQRFDGREEWQDQAADGRGAAASAVLALLVRFMHAKGVISREEFTSDLEDRAAGLFPGGLTATVLGHVRALAIAIRG
jgi:hypothetical protein